MGPINLVRRPGWPAVWAGWAAGEVVTAHKIMNQLCGFTNWNLLRSDHVLQVLWALARQGTFLRTIPVIPGLPPAVRSGGNSQLRATNIQTAKPDGLAWARLAMWWSYQCWQRYEIISFLQLVVGWLKDHHFSFERFSNKVHMETTMELSTGRGPSEELWSMSCLCAAVISSPPEFYFHHVDVWFKDTRIKCQFSDRLQCILQGWGPDWARPPCFMMFSIIKSII